MSGHTPGPWRYLGDDNYGNPLLGVAGQVPVAWINPAKRNPDKSNPTEPNLALIVAAPDLLAAARAVRRVVLVNTPDEDPLIVALDAAIARAEGRA